VLEPRFLRLRECTCQLMSVGSGPLMAFASRASGYDESTRCLRCLAGVVEVLGCLGNWNWTGMDWDGLGC
jgi:hypothetical protein